MAATEYISPGPSREEVDATAGPVILEFGTNWCGHCQAATSIVAKAMSRFPDATHIKVEDGPGRPLGRSYRVKLWPTLIFLKDGKEIARAVRPVREDEVTEGLSQIC